MTDNTNAARPLHGIIPQPTAHLVCQVCLDNIQSPFSTRCGHSFCHDCIFRQLDFSNACPTCSSPLTVEDIFPNFALELALRANADANATATATITTIATATGIRSATREDVEGAGQVEANLDLPTLRRRIDILIARKRRLEKEQKSLDTRSLLEFLLMARSHKQDSLNKISAELTMLDRDISRMKQRLDVELATTEESPVYDGDPEVPVIQEDFPRTAKRPHLEPQSSQLLQQEQASYQPPQHHPTPQQPAAEEVASSALMNMSAFTLPNLLDTKAMIEEHYADLQSCYFDETVDDPLDTFGEKIARLSKLTRIRQVATLKLGDIAGSSNIISSIEFDRNAQIFATAGVSKKIRFYDYRDALNSNLDLHCPFREIACKSKLSCISWNPYVQGLIAAADYEGLVTVYDSLTGAIICNLEEHEKRCWSVDYSSTDPTRLASGSDDCYVKLWSTKMRKSVCTIDGKANICSVRFHPERGYLLAFGSADHNVHLYDLRYASKPLDLLKGHKKAVSYVRFADSSSIVSASTDCTLKLWTLAGQNLDLPSASANITRTFSGHLNEKNFVGLGVQGDLFACGSENNSVYIYHRDLSKPLTTFRFPSTCPLTESAVENEVQQFVSSICWKPDSNQLVAANSQGNIRVLEIV